MISTKTTQEIIDTYNKPVNHACLSSVNYEVSKECWVRVDDLKAEINRLSVLYKVPEDGMPLGTISMKGEALRQFINHPISAMCGDLLESLGNSGVQDVSIPSGLTNQEKRDKERYEPVKGLGGLGGSVAPEPKKQSYVCWDCQSSTSGMCYKHYKVKED